MKYAACIAVNGDLQWKVVEVGSRVEARAKARANNPGAVVNTVSLTYLKRNWPDVWKDYQLHLKAQSMEEEA